MGIAAIVGTQRSQQATAVCQTSLAPSSIEEEGSMQKAVTPPSTVRWGTNPAVGVLRTLTLMATGKVHFHPEDIHKILETDDGARYRVFRHVVVNRQAPPPTALFIVRFTVKGMTVRQNIRFSRLPMFVFMGFAGFRSKYWCVDDTTGAYQGVYEWQTHAHAEAYVASIALRFMTNRSIPGSLSYRILDRASDKPWPITLYRQEV